MPSVFEDRARERLLARLDQLQPDLPPRWGRLSPAEMLCHNVDALRYALGELEAAPQGGPMGHWPLNWLVIHVLPWPRGKAESPPELVDRTTADWVAELVRLKDLLARVASRGVDAAWPPSPAFGRIRGKDWGVLVHKHLDHHLRQFGV